MKRNRIISMIVSLCMLLSAVFVPTMTSFADEAVAGTAQIYSDPVVVLEDFNSGDSVWGKTPVDENTVAGVDGGAIDPGGVTALPEAWDISAYKEGYAFKLRVYASGNMTFPTSGDADWAFVFGQDTDGSEGGNVDAMLRLAYGKSFYLTAGWNELYLPISAGFIADGGDGNWNNLSKITHVRMYDTGSGAGQIYLDDVSIVKYTAPQPKYDAATRELQLDAADDITPYQDRRAMYTPGIKKEGAAATFTFAGHNWIKRAYEPTDAHVSMKEGAVKFWLYVNDPNQIGNMWFELKDADGTKLNYQKDKFGTLVAGWNEVTLNLSDGTVSEGTTEGFDTSAIVFSHIEANGPDYALGLLYGIDDMRIVNLNGGCPHDTTEVQNAADATCTADGYTGDTVCTDCGDMIIGVLLPATGHNYVDGTCANCGEAEPAEPEEPVEKTNLALGKPATATVVDLIQGFDEDAGIQNGDNAWYKVSAFGDLYSADKAVDGDMDTFWAAPWARGGSEFVIDLEAVYNLKEIKLSFPETAGNYHQMTAYVSADNTTWIEFVPEIYAISEDTQTGEFTLTNEGIDARYVKLTFLFLEPGQMGYADGTEFPKIPEIEIYNVATVPCEHANTEVQNKADATCTADGYTGDTVCTDCGKTVTAGEVITATGHNYVDGTCANCGEAEPTPNLALGKPAQAKVAAIIASYETWDMVVGDDAVYHQDPALVAANAVDGDMNTFWAAPWARGVFDFTIDLEAVYNVNEIKLSYPETAGSHHAVTAYVSEDNVTWTEFAPEFYDAGEVVTLTNEGIDAQYVKLSFLFAEPNTVWNGKTYEKEADFPKVPEIEVRGAAEGGDVTVPCEHLNTEVQNVTDATCTEDGYTGDTVCLDCGETLAKGEVIAATGHSYVDGTCTVCGEAESAEKINIALGKPAQASETYSDGYKAEYAFDGDFGSRWAALMGGDARQVTLQTDLGAVYNITEIMLNFETADTYQYKVEVSEDAKTWTTFVDKLDKTEANDQIVSELVEAGVAGRHVKITFNYSETAAFPSLWEVAVYGTETGETGEAPMTATATGVYENNPIYGPDKAIDGDLNTSWAAPWALGIHELTVDLGKVETVTDVQILCAEEDVDLVRAVTVLVSEDGLVWEAFGEENTAAGTVITVTNEGINARYVKMSFVFSDPGQEWNGKVYETKTAFPKVAEAEITVAVGGDVTIPCYHENTEVQNVTDATCTEEGYTGDTVCLDCGETLAEGEVIKANGHSGVVIEGTEVDPSCTEAGKAADEKCTVCGDMITGDVIPATGHDNLDVQNAVDATCTENGYTGDIICTDCGETVTPGEVILANGHDYAEVEDTAADATCTEEGKAADEQCAVCGDVITGEAIPANGHSYESGVCANCGALYETVVEIDGALHYVKDGALTNYNGLKTMSDGVKYVFADGVVRTDFTGVHKHGDGRLYYIENGKFRAYNGLKTMPDGAKYLFNWGAVRVDFTGIHEHAGKLYYIVEGKFNAYNGLKTMPSGAKYLLTWGVVRTDFTGLHTHAGLKYYIENGKFRAYNGLKTINGVKYVLNKGILNTSVTGYHVHAGASYYVVNGVAMTGLKEVDGVKYLFSNGLVNTAYTGYYTHGTKDFYLVKGVAANGVVVVDGVTCTFKNGVLIG